MPSVCTRLLSPITIGGKTVPNRFAVNAMECCDADELGRPTERTFQRYKRYFEGGCGFIDLEAITCQSEHISSSRQLAATPRSAAALKSFVSRLKAINSENVFVFQLTHAGEVSHPVLSDPVRVTAAPLYGYEGARLIGEMEVDKIIRQYVDAALIARDSGADGVDLKLCTGYLGSQILRPFNSHKWKYGGPWENRRQFAFDLIESISKAVRDKNFIIGSKVSVYEGFPGGQGTAGPDSALMDLTESIDLVKGLEARGASYFIETAGGPRQAEALSKPDRHAPEMAYFHHYFQKVLRHALRPETAVIGSCYSIFRNGRGTAFRGVAPEKNSALFWGEKNIAEGITDMVCLGRQSLADPYIPAKLRAGREEEINWCVACDKCSTLLINQKSGGCAVYDPECARALKEIKK